MCVFVTFSCRIHFLIISIIFFLLSLLASLLLLVTFFLTVLTSTNWSKSEVEFQEREQELMPSKDGEIFTRPRYSVCVCVCVVGWVGGWVGGSWWGRGGACVCICSVCKL